MYRSGQKPQVVSNNSVNINFSQKVQDQNLACEMIRSGQKPQVVSNNSVNINFSQKVQDQNLACEMIRRLLLYLFM